MPEDLAGSPVTPASSNQGTRNGYAQPAQGGRNVTSHSDQSHPRGSTDRSCPGVHRDLSRAEILMEGGGKP